MFFVFYRIQALFREHGIVIRLHEVMDMTPWVRYGLQHFRPEDHREQRIRHKNLIEHIVKVEAWKKARYKDEAEEEIRILKRNVGDLAHLPERRHDPEKPPGNECVYTRHLREEAESRIPAGMEPSVNFSDSLSEAARQQTCNCLCLEAIRWEMEWNRERWEQADYTRLRDGEDQVTPPLFDSPRRRAPIPEPPPDGTPNELVPASGPTTTPTDVAPDSERPVAQVTSSLPGQGPPGLRQPVQHSFHIWMSTQQVMLDQIQESSRRPITLQQYRDRQVHDTAATATRSATSDANTSATSDTNTQHQDIDENGEPLDYDDGTNFEDYVIGYEEEDTPVTPATETPTITTPTPTAATPMVATPTFATPTATTLTISPANATPPQSRQTPIPMQISPQIQTGESETLMASSPLQPHPRMTINPPECPPELQGTTAVVSPTPSQEDRLLTADSTRDVQLMAESLVQLDQTELEILYSRIEAIRQTRLTPQPMPLRSPHPAFASLPPETPQPMAWGILQLIENLGTDVAPAVGTCQMDTETRQAVKSILPADT